MPCESLAVTSKPTRTISQITEIGTGMGRRFRRPSRLTVDQVVSKRMVKKQQMQWTEAGAHHLLQVRTKVLNDELRETFACWYPGMRTDQEANLAKKAA